MTPTLLTPSVVALPYYPCTASPLTSHPFNWLDEMSDSSEPTEIKVEPVTVSPFFGQCAQLAPQDSPFLLSPALSIAAPLPLPIALRKRSLSTSDRFRRHPYSTYSRRTRVLEYSADLDSMSSNPQNPYATWTPPSSRGQQSLSPPSYPTRRPSDNVQLDPSSIYPSEFGSQNSLMGRRSRGPTRPESRTQPSISSSGSSSLSGAIGPTRSVVIPPRSSGPPSTPSPPTSDASTLKSLELMRGMRMTSGGPTQGSLHALNSAAMGPNSADFASYADYTNSGYNDMYTPPSSNSPQVPTFTVPDVYTSPNTTRFQQPRTTPQGAHSSASHGAPQQMTGMASPPTSRMYSGSGFPTGVSQEEVMQEMTNLRTTIRELQATSNFWQSRVSELENERRAGSAQYATGHLSSPTPSGLPSPLPSPVAPPAFHHSWRARTDARVKNFCAPNRAGNALCAWHDSRRERRAFPPRMAPAGFLNCGCSFEEALFEESLTRHGVGSYLPGDTVRMDPALRNPLLRLLQRRYGYQDGDFERNPATGGWVEGEGHEVWEAALSAGALRARRGEGSR